MSLALYSFEAGQLTQARKVTDKKAKKYYHVIRLLYELRQRYSLSAHITIVAGRLSRGEPPKVFLVGEERDRIMAIRLGSPNLCCSKRWSDKDELLAVKLKTKSGS